MLVWNCSTVEAILRLHAQGIEVGVLNFASAKNPGGGFINGANAQEESLAVSGGLYRTLTVHETYYSKNRECKSMMYTNHAIYSPNVVFFRDERSRLMEEPVTASVLTIPAVNMGQVLLKGEDPEKAKQVMRERMKLILSIFARQNCKHLVLGACHLSENRRELRKQASKIQPQVSSDPFYQCTQARKHCPHWW